MKLRRHATEQVKLVALQVDGPETARFESSTTSAQHFSRMVENSRVKPSTPDRARPLIFAVKLRKSVDSDSAMGCPQLV
jgi:hypothetical protein